MKQVLLAAIALCLVGWGPVILSGGGSTGSGGGGGGGLTLRGCASDATTGAGTPVVNLSGISGYVEGDILLAIYAADTSTDPGGPTTGTWTALDDGNNGSGVWHSMDTETAPAGPPSSYTFADASTNQSAVICVFGGASETVDDIQTTDSSTGATTQTAPAATASADVIVIRALGFDNCDTCSLNSTPHSGTYAGTENFAVSNNLVGFAWDHTTASAGAVGTADFTTSTSNDYWTTTILIKAP